MPTEILAQVAGSYELPGKAVFPESIGVDGATGDAYVGSLADGSLYRLTGAGKAQVWGAGGQDGRGSVAGSRSMPGAGCGPRAATTAHCGSTTWPPAP